MTSDPPTAADEPGPAGTADATATTAANDAGSADPTDLAAWQAALPACTPAEPSDDRHPPLAFPVMLAGVVASALAGAAMAAVYLGVLALFLGCVQTVSLVWQAAIELLGRAGDFIILFFIAFFSFGGIFIGAGAVLPRFARWARNRNAASVFLYGLAAGLLAAAVVKVPVVLKWAPTAPSIRQVGLWPAVRFSIGLNGWDRVLTCVWAVASALMTGAMAFGAVADDRYCRPCSRFMKEVACKRLKFGGLRRLVAAVAARRFDEAGRAVRDAKRGVADGSGGRVVVHRCPGCGEGFVEASAFCQSADGSRTWTVVSERLTAADVGDLWPEEPGKGRRKGEGRKRGQAKRRGKKGL